MDEVRRLRKRKGLSQVELAELAGVSPFTITEIETGRREPRGSTLRKIAQVLDTTVADLYRDTEPGKEPEPRPKVEAPSPPKTAGAAPRLTLDDVAEAVRNIDQQIAQYIGRDDVSIRRAEEEAKPAEGAWLLAQELGRKLAPGDTVAEVDHPELQSAMDALLRDADRLVKDAQSRADEDARRREQGRPRELPDDAADGIA